MERKGSVVQMLAQHASPKPKHYGSVHQPEQQITPLPSPARSN